MNYKKIALWLGIPAFLLAGVGYLAVEHILPYSGIKPMRRTGEQMAWYLPKGVDPSNYGLTFEKMRIQTPDTLQLSALLVHANTDTTKGVVVVLHGISGCKETQLERAQLLAEAGYACLLPDLRAHGESGGEYCTFGYYEKYDLQAIADTLQARFPRLPLGIWGASLGGAIALQGMAADPRYNFGIVESTFHDFKMVAMEFGADWFFGLRSHWMTDRVLENSGKIARFDPFSIQPARAAQQITRPVLFMHGDKDSRIPMWFGERNYEVCPAPGKKWRKVQGAGHNNLWRVAGESLWQEVRLFLAEQSRR
ncbi:MAG: alpha/beta fold hydrolase [Saprospiraceae bacterium]|nr:alpha/beta fold hydrolase [Saprospiraceae bacterium]